MSLRGIDTHNDACASLAVLSTPSSVQEYKVTPGLADAAHECLLRALTPAPASAALITAPSPLAGSHALARGNAIHTLLKIDMRRRLAGQPPLDADELIVRGTPRTPWRDDPSYSELARDCIVGMRAYLEEEELEVLRAEEFVRTRPRPLRGDPRIKIVLSGRFDLVCRRSDGRMVLPDMKTGSRLPSDIELAARPSTTVYTLLAHELRRHDEAIRERTTADVEVVQILSHLAAYASARLTEVDVDAGRAWLRTCVKEMAEGVRTATPGEWCAYCSLFANGACPAWAARHRGSQSNF